MHSRSGIYRSIPVSARFGRWLQGMGRVLAPVDCPSLLPACTPPAWGLSFVPTTLPPVQ